MRLKKEIAEVSKKPEYVVHSSGISKLKLDALEEFSKDRETFREMYEGNWDREKTISESLDQLAKACEKIAKKAFNKNTKTVEKNRWYKSKRPDSKFLGFMTNNTLSDDGALSHNCGYGFDYKGEWVDVVSLVATEPDMLTPATDKEVKTALINEAKKRGFKEGTTIKTIDGNCITLKGYEFELINDVLYTSTKPNEDIIFKEGKWAEVIEDPKPQLPKIGCQEGEELPGAIKYGDKALSKDIFRRLEKIGVTSITIDHEHHVCKPMLDQIYKVAKQ